MRTSFRLGSVLTLMLAASPMWAEQQMAVTGGGTGPSAAPTDPLLEALIAEALGSSPDLALAERRQHAAAQRVEQAGALPDPMLSVLYRNDGWSPSLGDRMMTNLGFMWSQPLPWPGKRELRSEMAGREAALGERQLDRARLGLVAAIRRAYSGLLLARETLGLLQEQEATAREIEGVARARYAVGQGAQQDVLRAQIEVARIEQLRAEQEAEEAIRLAEINRLAARPAESALETSARLELVSETRVLESFQVAAEAASPELGAALLEQERDGLAVELADKDGRPDFVVEAGYMNRGGLDPMWQAGVGVRLPLWRGRLQARRGEVALQREASERLGEAVRLQLRFRNQERLAQLSATERVARLYQEGIVPQAQMSVEAALASYKSGRVPFVTVLEALSTYYGDRAGLLRLLARHAQLRASLEELSLDSAPVLSAPSAAGGGMNAAGPSAGMPAGME